MSRRKGGDRARWIPLGVGLCAVVGLTAGSLALGSEGGAVPASNRTQPQQVQVAMDEIPLVCPPGIIVPEDVAPVRVYAPDEPQGDAEPALTALAPGQPSNLVGGGEVRMLGSEAGSGLKTKKTLSDKLE